MQYISTIQYRYEEAIRVPDSTSEYKQSLIDQTKAFWEIMEKKYGIDISKVDSISADGTIILK